jgi:hypothetical protein
MFADSTGYHFKKAHGSEDVVELRIPQAARSAALGELRFYESSEHELVFPTHPP